MSTDPRVACFDTNLSSLLAFQECVRENALSRMRYMSSTQAAVFTFIYAFISLLGALGNGLVIFVVARRPEMRTTRNVFIVNLAISNFLLALILVPFLWLPTYRVEFPYGSFMCKVAQAFPSTNVFCSTLTVSVIAVDRYYVVVRARLGPGKVKSLQAILIALGIWILSYSLSILYFLHFHTKDYVLPSILVPEHLIDHSGQRRNGLLLFQSCELMPRPCQEMQTRDSVTRDEIEACHKFYETALSALTALFIYFVPMPILIIYSYLLSRFLAKTQRQHAALRHRVCAPMSTADGTAPSGRMRESHSLSDALLSAASSVIGRRSRGPTSTNRNDDHHSSPATRQRSRTTFLLFAMAFSNAILWLPFIIVSMVIQLAPSKVTLAYQTELRQLDDAAKLISMLSICVNPFLYGYLNTNFNREFKLIFAKCCPFLRGGQLYNSNGRFNSLMSLRSTYRRTGGAQGGKMEKTEMDSNSISVYADQKSDSNGKHCVKSNSNGALSKSSSKKSRSKTEL